jgi:signal transduction histidine kinase
MQLSAARNVLASDPAAAAEHLESALQLNRDTQQELKLIIDELRPAALEGKGLAEAVREYAKRWQQHTGTKVETIISDERALPLDVEQSLYRVAQEALSNVARHAGADRVVLSLSMGADRVTLVVADNGRGFDKSAIPQGTLGLESMRQRLADVGGTLKIDPVPSVGTTLTAEVELSPAPVAERDLASAN